MTTLSPDYQNVLTWLELQQSDLRREQRVSVDAKVAVIHVDQSGVEALVSVIARDLTPEGIGLLSQTPMSVGQSFVLYLDDAEPSRITCRVRHCRIVGQNRYHIGASFRA
jgi:hypothetical protein